MEFTKINKLKNKLDNLRPLSVGETEKLREMERIEEVYNSNAIEGNTLTLYETRMILETGITVAEKSIKEHLETINLNEAIWYVESLVNEKQPLTENMIKTLHRLVYDKLARDKKNVGNYRTIGVWIQGSRHLPPEPFLVPIQMEELIRWSNENRDELHPVEYAALLHEKFVTIHPFIDGNGRTARLLLNFALTQAGYPPIIVKADKDSRDRYMKSLEIANTENNREPFIEFIQELVEEKLIKMISILETSEKLIEFNDCVDNNS